MNTDFEYTDLWCSKCGYNVVDFMYETGKEQQCDCQSTLHPDFNPELWYKGDD